jgi:hypothetical protein
MCPLKSNPLYLRNKGKEKLNTLFHQIIFDGFHTGQPAGTVIPEPMEYI